MLHSLVFSINILSVFITFYLYLYLTYKDHGAFDSISKSYYATKTNFQFFVYALSYFLCICGILSSDLKWYYWLIPAVLLAGVGLTPTINIKWHRTIHMICAYSAIISTFVLLAIDGIYLHILIFGLSSLVGFPVVINGKFKYGGIIYLVEVCAFMSCFIGMILNFLS